MVIRPSCWAGPGPARETPDGCEVVEAGGGGAEEHDAGGDARGHGERVPDIVATRMTGPAVSAQPTMR